MELSYSVFADAEEFTNEMIKITTSEVKTIELTNFIRNIIRILNLDVEDHMYSYKTLKSNKRVVILFAKDTQYGKEHSMYRTERISFGKDIVEIIVLPSSKLLEHITNPEILLNLDYIYAFLLQTPKPSVDYVSPMEIAKHLYARYYFKFKFFINAFEMDNETIDSLKLDIVNSGLDTLVSFDHIYKIASNQKITSEDLFDKNEILDYIDASVYYQIVDDLQSMAGEADEEETDEETE